MIRGPTLKILVEIWKQNTTEKAEGPGSEPEPKDRTKTILKLTEGFRLTEAGSSNWTGNYQDAWLDMRSLWDRTGLCVARLRCLISSRYLRGLMHRNLYCCRTLEMTIQMICLQFMRKCLLLKLSFARFQIFYKLFII
jgi:hypothetical protein